MYFHLVVFENQDINEVIEEHKKVCERAKEYTVLRQDRLNSSVFYAPNDPYFSTYFRTLNTQIKEDVSLFNVNLMIGRKQGHVCVFKITDVNHFHTFLMDMIDQKTFMHQSLGTRELMYSIKRNSRYFYKGEFIAFEELDEWIPASVLESNKFKQYRVILSQPINREEHPAMKKMNMRFMANDAERL